MTSTVGNLTQIEALSLINRWAKLKYYFHSLDIDKLYSLKHQKVKEWIGSGDLILSKVVKRENPIFQNIQQEIDNELEDIGVSMMSEIDCPSEIYHFFELVDDSYEVNGSCVDWKNYNLGDIEEVDKLIEWLKDLVEDKFPENLSQIDDCYICDVVEPKIVEWEVYIPLKDYFLDIVSGKYETPEEVRDILKMFPVDYSPIGIRSLEPFTTWHRIHLSYTGYWLLEARSAANPESIFHIPFDIAKSMKIDSSNLPIEKHEGTFGRAISPEEMLLYPIEELLNVLGMSSTDFPNKLSRTISSTYAVPDWEDEDEF